MGLNLISQLPFNRVLTLRKSLQCLIICKVCRPLKDKNVCLADTELTNKMKYAVSTATDSPLSFTVCGIQSEEHKLKAYRSFPTGRYTISLLHPSSSTNQWYMDYFCLKMQPSPSPTRDLRAYWILIRQDTMWPVLGQNKIINLFQVKKLGFTGVRNAISEIPCLSLMPKELSCLC